MNRLLEVAEPILLEYLLSSYSHFSNRSKVGIGLIALSGFTMVIGLSFLAYGIYLSLLSYYQPEIAALIMGCLAFALTLIFAGTAYATLIHRRRTRAKKLQTEIREITQTVMDIVNDDFAGSVSENPKTAVLIASVAGYLIGQNIV